MDQAFEVIIISKRDDHHAEAVMNRVHQLGHSCTVVDFASASTGSLRGFIEASGNDPFLELDGVRVSSASTLWWRRVAAASVRPEVWDDRIRHFVVNEWKHGLHGLLQATGCRIVNHPLHESRASLKPVQLAAARRAGLNIPETCITNDIYTAREFIDRLEAVGKRVIYKPLTAPRYHLAETRAVRCGELKETELAISPVIFQECIERGMDIRATVIGEDVFVAGVVSRHEELIDWRIDLTSDFTPQKLEECHKAKLLELMRELHLETGSADLRIDREGNIFFFEVNPAGQFLFLEGATGQPLSLAMAKLLLSSN